MALVTLNTNVQLATDAGFVINVDNSGNAGMKQDAPSGIILRVYNAFPDVDVTNKTYVTFSSVIMLQDTATNKFLRVDDTSPFLHLGDVNMKDTNDMQKAMFAVFDQNYLTTNTPIKFNDQVNEFYLKSYYVMMSKNPSASTIQVVANPCGKDAACFGYLKDPKLAVQTLKFFFLRPGEMPSPNPPSPTPPSPTPPSPTPTPGPNPGPPNPVPNPVPSHGSQSDSIFKKWQFWVIIAVVILLFFIILGIVLVKFS